MFPLPAAGSAAIHAAQSEAVELTHRLHALGQYISASPWHPISTATCVRIRDGKRLVTDGPFAETREFLCGFDMVQARDLNSHPYRRSTPWSAFRNCRSSTSLRYTKPIKH
jgi:hypothetical protein